MLLENEVTALLWRRGALASSTSLLSPPNMHGADTTGLKPDVWKVTSRSEPRRFAVWVETISNSSPRRPACPLTFSFLIAVGLFLPQCMFVRLCVRMILCSFVQNTWGGLRVWQLACVFVCLAVWVWEWCRTVQARSWSTSTRCACTHSTHVVNHRDVYRSVCSVVPACWGPPGPPGVWDWN